MNSINTVSELEKLQSELRHTGMLLDDNDYRQQYHTDLSPLGWHVGHCAFIETYWLREIVLENAETTAELHHLYFPENMPKPERGPALPAHQEHLGWCETLNQENRSLLENPPDLLREHHLSKNDYLGMFILQHHAQHLETMQMVLQQRAIKRGASEYTVKNILTSAAQSINSVTLPAGEYRIGSEHQVEAFDNELPPHTVSLQETLIAQQPVNNANWLAFIEDDAYNRQHYWSDEGWLWRIESACRCPEHWQQDTNGHWFGLDHTGPHDLAEDAPVYGINYFEAMAFVNWLSEKLGQQLRLPHEYEWEAACNMGLLKGNEQVWEWCENTFHAYEGFTPFPYDNYSKPWFDNKHFVLRGGSRQTCDVIKRSSFRNFYNPDKRHIFAGLRLALSQ